MTTTFLKSFVYSLALIVCIPHMVRPQDDKPDDVYGYDAWLLDPYAKDTSLSVLEPSDDQKHTNNQPPPDEYVPFYDELSEYKRRYQDSAALALLDDKNSCDPVQKPPVQTPPAQAPSTETPSAQQQERQALNLFQDYEYLDECLEYYDAQTLPPLVKNIIACGRHDCGPNSCLLIYGPSGTGKTSLAHIIARETQREVYVSPCAALGTTFMNSASENLRLHFDAIKKRAQERPLVLLLDEVDTIARKVTAPYQQDLALAYFDNVRLILANELTQLAKQQGLYDQRIILVATTNNLDLLDSTIRTRFGQNVLRLDLPKTVDERYTLLQRYARQYNSDGHTPFADTDLMRAARQTDGYSLRELHDLMRNAANQCIVQGRMQVEWEDIYAYIAMYASTQQSLLSRVPWRDIASISAPVFLSAVPSVAIQFYFRHLDKPLHEKQQRIAEEHVQLAHQQALQANEQCAMSKQQFAMATEAHVRGLKEFDMRQGEVWRNKM